MIWGREAGRGQGPAGGDGSAGTPDVSEDEPGEGEEGEQADGGAQGVAERERLGGGGSILGEPEDAEDEEGRAHDKGPHGDVRLAAELVLVVGLPLAACSASVKAGGVGSRQGDHSKMARTYPLQKESSRPSLMATTTNMTKSAAQSARVDKATPKEQHAAADNCLRCTDLS